MLCFFAGKGCGGSMKKLFLRNFEFFLKKSRRGYLNEISQCSASGQGRGGSMKNLHMKFPHVLFFPTRAAEVV